METKRQATIHGVYCASPHALYFSIATSLGQLQWGALSLETGVTCQVQIPLVYLSGNRNYSITCYYGNKI